MKTIDEGIKEAYLKSGDNAYFGNGFKAGVEFAQRWISINEETPLAFESGQWDGLRSDFVLAKNKWGNVYIARTYEGILDSNKFCDFAERDDTIISHIIEWRPIEFK